MEDPPRIPPKPRYYNDNQLQNIRSVAKVQRRSNALHKTKVTITTQKPNATPYHQIIYPLPSRSLPHSGYFSETGTQVSESGYNSAQTQKTGTTKSQKTGTNPSQSENHTTTTAILRLIKDGIKYYKEGKYVNAMKLFKSVLKSQVIRRSQGNNPIVGNVLGNIGSVYLQLHRYDHAIESLEKAVRMIRRSKTMQQSNNSQQISPTDVPLAWVLNNLGTAKFFKGDHKASLECYWGAIEDAKTHNGKSSTVEIANSLYNIGRIGVFQRDYSMALDTLKRSLELETVLHGAKSIEAVDTLNLIGFVHYSTGGFDRAMSIFTEALSIVTTSFGSVHEKVAVSLVNVGMVLEKEGHLEEALRCFATAQTVCDKAGLDEKNSTRHTATRSANDIRRELSAAQYAKSSKRTKESMGIEKRDVESSKRTKENMGVEKCDRGPSFSQRRNAFAARDVSGYSVDQRNEIHRVGQVDWKKASASIHQRRKTFPFAAPTIDDRTQNNDPCLKVRRVGKKVDVPTYAAYKNRLKLERAIIEYREDPYWEYDDASIVDEDRDESE